MTITTVELGGAPWQEDCAQVGQTPDFIRVNDFEVRCYRAALIGLHGSPPEHCELRPRLNAHDFGSYRTLELAIGDQAAMRAARAYAERMEQGVATWLAAGMAAPVTYEGAVATLHKRSVADVVFGALLTTRPAIGGRFPLPAFATIHANLSAAFPAVAARFASLTYAGELA